MYELIKSSGHYWLRFDLDVPEQAGDRGYIEAYASNTIQKIEENILYFKIWIYDICYVKDIGVKFHFKYCKAGNEVIYDSVVGDPERIFEYVEPR